MVIIISAILLCLEFITCCKNLKYGLCWILIITFLIPNIVSFPIGGINLNVFNLSILILFALGIKRFKRKFLISKQVKQAYDRTLTYFYLTSFLITIGSYGILFFFKNTILNFLEYYAISFILMHLIFNEKELSIINKVLAVLSLIVAGYALFNYITKSNPYLSLIIILTGAHDMITSFLSEQRGALDGRVSSTFMHPLMLGEMMLLTFSYLYYQLRRNNKIFSILVLSGCFIATVLTGARSALFPILFIPIFHGLYIKRKYLFKIIFSCLLIAPCIYSILPKEYKATFEAMVFIWDSSKSDDAGISGSNSDMRANQLVSALKIVDDCIFFGKGNGYVKTYGDKHPEMLGYEGLFLFTIVEYGLIGTIVFCLFYFYLTIFLYKYAKTPIGKAQVLSLCIPFFMCISLTGIQYGVFSFFMILYFLTFNSLRIERSKRAKGNALSA